MLTDMAWMYRDQRTVKVPHYPSPRYPERHFHSVGELLTVCICVLLVVPGGMSHPVDKDFWLSPCGTRAHDHHSSSSDSSESLGPRSTSALLDAINSSARSALIHAELFREEFVRKTWGVEYENHHRDWMTQGYDWLPSKEEIPKTLGERLAKHHLPRFNEVALDKFLLDSYRYLQTIAVGLDQVHEDMTRRSAQFSTDFGRVKNKLRQLLCEVQSAIGERLPEHRIEDVTREVMGQEYRSIVNDAAIVNLRDWLIFRDYMNCLEYIIELCEYFISSAN